MHYRNPLLFAAVATAVVATVAAMNPWDRDAISTATPAIDGSQAASTVGQELIVQAASADVAAQAVTSVGGELLRRLDVINAVGARLSPQQRQQLASKHPDIIVHGNAKLRVSGKGKGRGAIRQDSAADTLAATDDPIAAENAPQKMTGNPNGRNVCGARQRQIGFMRTPESYADDAIVPTNDDGIDAVSMYAALLESNFPEQVGAADLHAAGIDGRGVGIAVIDTGLWNNMIESIVTDGRLEVSRKVRAVDMLDGRDAVLFDGTCYNNETFDDHGHGTHVSSIAASSSRSISGRFQGVAPGANLISIRAFDESGSGSYMDVISAIQWAIDNRREYNIRVLNMSFSAPPQSWYWEDPLNQAVMKAWDAGIVVVAAAGNGGPDPMTIGVPGNVPYVITVGATSDNYTPHDRSDDFLAYFSATGPTFEGHVKPDVVAPGGQLLGVVPDESQLYMQFGEDNALSFGSNHKLGEAYFVMSGTSQATAVVTGAAALLIQKHPRIEPDNVKCALMSTARPAGDADGKPMYTVFQQGAGSINVNDAIHNGARACANRGLDVGLDLSGSKHYQGPAAQDALGNYYVMDVDRHGDGTQMPLDGEYMSWDAEYSWGTAEGWGVGYPWNVSRSWSVGYPWNVSRSWSVGYPWNVSRRPKLAGISGISAWIDHEPKR